MPVPPHRRLPALAWLILLATLLLWAGNWIVARAVRAEISPGIATVIRLAIVLSILLPFTARGLIRKLPQLEAAHWKVLAVLGLCGGGLHLALQWLGMHYTTATSGILYLSTSPLFILLMARPLLGERIVLRQWLGLAVSSCGIVLIATQGNLTGFTFNVGDVMALFSMMMWAGYTVFLRLRRDPLDTAEFLTVVCGFGALYMSPWLLWELAGPGTLNLTGTGLVAVAYSAIGSFLLAYAGWSYVVNRLGAARAGVTIHLMPALGTLMAILFLGEYPRWFHGVGIGLILAGVGLSSSAKRA